MLVPFFNENQMINSAIPTAWNSTYQEGFGYGYSNMFSFSAAMYIPLYQLCPTANDRLNFFAGYGMGRGWASAMDAMVAGIFMEALAKLDVAKLAQEGKLADAIAKAEAATNAAINIAAEALQAPKIFVNARGQITNGTYTIDSAGMTKHLTGSTTSGKSQFLFGIDAEKAVLDAASYADEFGLWVNNQAKVPVTNGNIGVIGRTGELTSWIEVTKTNTNFVHGWPCSK
jgi:hypothetical protein